MVIDRPVARLPAREHVQLLDAGLLRAGPAPTTVPHDSQ